MKRFRRGLAILLSTCMIGGMMPITTSAQEPVSGNTVQTEDTAISAIQALIDELPDADSITEDSAEEVTAQLDAIDEAKAELTDEELAQLDLTRYDAAAAKMMALMGMEGAGEATFAAEEPSFGGGTGTQEAPWLITSQGDLIALAEFLNSGKAEEFDAGNNDIGNCHGYYFKQTADIDLTGVLWEPIGYSGSYYFAGNYDGDGHTISNATSTGKKDDNGHATAGIFGWVAFGSVENLYVKNANFVATGQNEYSYVGGIAGVCYGSSIKNCSVVNSSLESKRYNDINRTGNCAGSIVGYSTGGTFEKCAVENNQVKTVAYGGGFVGEVDDRYGVGNSKFTNSYVANCTVISKTDEVHGISYAGGFVGAMTQSKLTIQNCYVYQVTPSIEGTAATYTQGTGVFAGDLTGANSTIVDTNCYFGACGMTDRAGTATEKQDEDFTNGTVAGLLGDVFVQARNYPRFKDSPADYSDVDAAIAKVNALNKDNYQDFSGVEAAVNAVKRDKNVTEQSEVDAMAKAIEDAIIALVYKDAEYTKVDEAIAKAKALNKDNYKDFSGVEAAVKAVVRGKNITEQSEVDKMAKAIEKAIDALEYKGADYTKVDAAIDKVNALNKKDYRDFSGVEAAVKAVVRGKNITKQSEVDAMAKAIEDAIKALVYKDADYTKVNEAIKKANALEKDNYKDFSGVEAAVKAVVRGKNITEQSEVDKMAKAIEKAIDALQYKGADYTKVDEAIAKAKALNKDNYKDFSGVDDAVKAVVRGNDITKQTEVDAMAKAIDDAISVLQYKDSDYTKVDAVIAKAPEPSIASGNNNNTNTNGGRVTGTSDSSKNTDSRNNSDTEIKPYIKDDSGKEGWDVINSQLDEAKSGETVTVVMNGTTVVPKDIFDSIKGEDVTLVLDMGDGISWKINGKDITDAAGDIDFGVTVGADAGKSIPVDVINNVTGERYYMNLSLAYDGEFGFTARLTINMEAKNTGLYANLFYYNEQTGKLEFVSAGLIDADGNVELEFTHASDYTIVIDADVMDGGNKDSINTTKDNENAEDNTTIPASNADNAKSDAWNPAIIIIIGICILLIVFGAVLYVRKKSGSEKE